jgi:transcription elongation GreA/GreB family factor
MSLAFLNEEQFAAMNADVIERKISPHLNYVTPQGFTQLKLQFSAQDTLLKALKASPEDAFNKTKIAELERDCRYFSARLESAIVLAPALNTEAVAFGTTVEVQDEAGDTHHFTIVGEDEADMKHHKVSYVSPIAKALIGQKVGDSVVWQRPMGNQNLEIIQITYSIESKKCTLKKP